MRARFYSLFLLLCFFLVGCDQSALVDKLASEEEQAFARSQVEHVRLREFEAIERWLEPRLHTPELRDTLGTTAGLIPGGALLSVKTVGVQRHMRDGVTTLSTTLEYEFTEGWILAKVIVAQRDGARTITGFHIYSRTQSLADENRLTLTGKGTAHILMLAATLGAFVVSVVALVRCIRTRSLHRKWLWILFIIAGFGKFTMNWTTGAFDVFPISLQLFSAGVMAQLGGPWMVSFSFPLGAIVFLVYARRQGPAP
ncbi:MAG: hypothetical protein ACREWI_03430 [Telluria sp.]